MKSGHTKTALATAWVTAWVRQILLHRHLLLTLLNTVGAVVGTFLLFNLLNNQRLAIYLPVLLQSDSLWYWGVVFTALYWWWYFLTIKVLQCLCQDSLHCQHLVLHHHTVFYSTTPQNLNTEGTFNQITNYIFQTRSFLRHWMQYVPIHDNHRYAKIFKCNYCTADQRPHLKKRFYTGMPGDNLSFKARPIFQAYGWLEKWGHVRLTCLTCEGNLNRRKFGNSGSGDAECAVWVLCGLCCTWYLLTL